MKRFILPALVAVILPACSQFKITDGNLPIQSGQVKMYPDGRWEIMIDPRTSK